MGELDLFHYFRTQVTHELSGVFDQDFWNVHLIQMIQVRPVLWYACNTVAATHQLYRSGGGNSNSVSGGNVGLIKENETAEDASLSPQNNKLETQSLQQYQRALQCLIEMTQQRNLSVEEQVDIIAANTLFMIMAWLRGDIFECFTHWLNGCKLIGQWKIWEHVRIHRSHDKFNIHPTDSMLYAYVRIGSMLMNIRHPAYRHESYWHECRLPLRPDSFISPTEAYIELELVWSSLLDATLDARPPPKEATDSKDFIRKSIIDRYERWKVKFKLMETSWQDQEDSSPVDLLRIRIMILDLIAGLDIFPLELDWDSRLPQFKNIVDASKRFLEKQGGSLENIKANARVGRMGRSMTLSPRLNEALYHVARRCRDPLVRRQAVSLMVHDYYLTAGINTALYICMNKAIIRIEEGAWIPIRQPGSIKLCDCIDGQFICDSHRVIETCLTYPSRGVADLLALTVEDIRLSRPWRSVRLFYGTSAEVVSVI